MFSQMAYDGKGLPAGSLHSSIAGIFGWLISRIRLEEEGICMHGQQRTWQAVCDSRHCLCLGLSFGCTADQGITPTSARRYKPLHGQETCTALQLNSLFDMIEAVCAAHGNSRMNRLGWPQFSGARIARTYAVYISEVILLQRDLRSYLLPCVLRCLTSQQLWLQSRSYSQA